MEKKYVKFDGEHGQLDLTSGKSYEFSERSKNCGLIEDDFGDEICIIVGENSAHLNESGAFYFCNNENVDVNKSTAKQVRPAMTPEARDILNSIHETVGAETRSDSIVEFMDKHTEMEVELCAVNVQLSTLEEQSKRRINGLEQDCDAWKDINQCSRNLLVNERKKVKGWMIYSAIVAAYAIGVSVYCLIGG